jgi:hypothetical protein
MQMLSFAMDYRVDPGAAIHIPRISPHGCLDCPRCVIVRALRQLDATNVKNNKATHV